MLSLLGVKKGIIGPLYSPAGFLIDILCTPVDSKPFFLSTECTMCKGVRAYPTPLVCSNRIDLLPRRAHPIVAYMTHILFLVLSARPVGPLDQLQSIGPSPALPPHAANEGRCKCTPNSVEPLCRFTCVCCVTFPVN